MTKIEIRDPQDLRLHPLQKKYIADPDKNSAEWLSFVDGQSAAGVDGIPPIFITHDGQIMEGGRRWRAAKQLGWSELQCQVRPEEDAAAIIVESLLGQRNLMRGTKVYIAITLLEEFVESAEHRRLGHLRNKVKTLEKPLNGISTAGWSKLGRPASEDSIRVLAERFGCGRELVRQAIELRKKFDADPELKVLWEPKLFTPGKGKDAPISIGAALAGIGGAPADQSGRDQGVEQSTFGFYEKLFAPLSEKAANYHWNRLPAEKREQIVATWTQEAKKWKPELRAAILEAIEAA
jgi:hypothetical protein